MYTLILTVMLWRGGTTINVTHGWSQHDCQVAGQTWLNAQQRSGDYNTTAVCVLGGPDGDVRITR